MRSLAVVMGNIITFQQTPYPFHKVDIIYDFLAQGLPCLSDEECCELSNLVEPYPKRTKFG